MSNPSTPGLEGAPCNIKNPHEYKIGNLHSGAKEKSTIHPVGSCDRFSVSEFINVLLNDPRCKSPSGPDGFRIPKGSGRFETLFNQER